MPVAEMPGQPQQVLRRRGRDLHQRFRRGAHAHEAAGGQREPIALLQHLRFRQVEQEGEAAFAGVEPPAAEAVVEIDRHRVAQLVFRPAAGGGNRGGAGDAFLHGQNRK